MSDQMKGVILFFRSMIRVDWINYFNNLSLFVMFTNQLIFIHLTKGMFREFSVQKSVHSRYIVGTQSAGLLEKQ